MGNINVAIIGVGNCASSLIQGIGKYSDSDSNSIIKLLELLEDHEDVQKIHSNFEVE